MKIKFTTGKDFVKKLEELVEEKSKQPPSKDEEELLELIMENDSIVEGTLEYLRKHPEKHEEIIERWKQEVKQKGESDEDTKKAEELFRKIIKALTQP